ncbi:hypothetical protein E4T44_11998 [Aureobasidium sp. EXF-8845]|nr:hypothetical protein E4T44_11998 [Aureobasidium sp. EXF-8845]
MDLSPVKVTLPVPLPRIKKNDSFNALIPKLARLARYFTDLVGRPITFEEFRTTQDHLLTPLCRHLLHDVHHPALVAALLVLKGHFVTLEADEEQGIHAARGFACEAVATRFIIGLADREIIDSLLYELELPDGSETDNQTVDEQPELPSPITEQSPLLSRSSLRSRGSYRSRLTIPEAYDGAAEDLSAATDSELVEQFDGLNALEIAAVSGAKKFLCQKQVQRIINAIWTGDIMFWNKLSADAQKKAQIYQRKNMDPFCRLRVPIYLKTFEVLFFAAFLAFYFAVLMQRSFYSVTTAEVFLYIWIASFAHNEIGEFWDAGTTTFYLADFWSLWDLLVIGIGVAFFITRKSCALFIMVERVVQSKLTIAGMIGLHQGNDRIIDTSFDILALEALFLIPRIFSPLLSLNPYFGTLLPCLTAMTKDFLKFLSLVAILYCGFLSTFCLLGRGQFTTRQMALILTKVFFGSAYLGFDISDKISPYLGLPLMLTDTDSSGHIAHLNPVQQSFLGPFTCQRRISLRLLGICARGIDIE